MTGWMEVAGRVSGRRRWSDTQKLEILAEAFRPGSCPPGISHIALPGGVRVSIDAHVDAGALARVLSVLR